jgi:hypothetical protein
MMPEKKATKRESSTQKATKVSELSSRNNEEEK